MRFTFTALLHRFTDREVHFSSFGRAQVFIDKKAGEWHFNPPHVPHAITSPHGKPHLSLWFREGGPGQEANNKFGPEWIGETHTAKSNSNITSSNAACFVLALFSWFRLYWHRLSRALLCLLTLPLS